MQIIHIRNHDNKRIGTAEVEDGHRPRIVSFQVTGDGDTRYAVLQDFILPDYVMLEPLQVQFVPFFDEE